MTAWSDHVKRYAKKHKMSYREASMNAKCKESYRKKRMSPRRMNFSGHQAQKMFETARGREVFLGRDPSIPPQGGFAPINKLPNELIFKIQMEQGVLNCMDISDLRSTSKGFKRVIDTNLKFIMKAFKRYYEEIYKNETPGMTQFEAAENPTWGQFKDICREAFSIGNRLILEAARNNNIRLIEKLIRAGISVNISGQYGVTPLHEACSEGHLDAVQLLLDNGAYKDQSNNYGQTPIYMACQKGHPGVVELLLDRGDDMNKVSSSGSTLIFTAVQYGHPDVVELLLDRGADANQTNNFGLTPLLMAIETVRLDIVQILLDGGADVNQTDKYGHTPLSKALRRNQAEIAELLRNYGAY